MFIYILKFSLVCLVLIILIHYLYQYFTSLYTTPKVKDLIFLPTKKYDELYELIKKDTKNNEVLTNDSKNIPITNNGSKLDMKTELKKYLTSQLPKMESIGSSKLVYSDIKST